MRGSNPEIPIVITTGDPSVETAKSAIADRVHDYLIKPVSKEELLRTVKFALLEKALIKDKLKLELEHRTYRENLEKVVETRTHALQEAVNGTISAIAKIIELKDPYTAGHEKRVANLSYKIAEKMNLTKEQKDCIYFAGYLHDIGKLLTPAETLSKPGRITDSELLLIRSHVESGYELVKDIQLPWIISDIILQHHERIDGSGYPAGLKGNETKIESKVLAVADVVEAMASHRPYRPAIEIETVLDELKQNSGILYGESIVAATVSLFEDEYYDFSSDINTISVEF